MGIKMLEHGQAVGRVHWELVDVETGKVVQQGEGIIESPWMKFIPKFMRPWLFNRYPHLLGQHNAIVNHMRQTLATAMIGTSVTFPGFIGIATGTGDITASDTALATPVDYDGANEAKANDSKSKRGLFTSRFVTQFTTAEANENIRQLGFFDAANSGNLWAKVSVVINKTSSERLNIYWYFTFERRSGLAIKSGESIGTSGNIALNTDSTLTFASPVTILRIMNNSGTLMHVKLNGGMDSGTVPTDYDYIIPDGESRELLNEEIEVSTVHIVMAEAITMPDNQVSIRGW